VSLTKAERGQGVEDVCKGVVRMILVRRNPSNVRHRILSSHRTPRSEEISSVRTPRCPQLYFIIPGKAA